MSVCRHVRRNRLSALDSFDTTLSIVDCLISDVVVCVKTAARDGELTQEFEIPRERIRDGNFVKCRHLGYG